MKQLVFDLGMYNGDDTHYYLMKGYRVVAVEANPRRIADAKIRFSDEIARGDLALVHAAIGTQDGTAQFFVNKKSDVISSLFTYGKGEPEDLEEFTVPSRSILSLLEEHGTPLYLKIDVEGMDQPALRQMLLAQVKVPPLISCEITRSDSLCYLSAMGYTRFYVQNCATIARRYPKVEIRTLSGDTLQYAFPEHSTGPFGEDIGEAYYDLDRAMLTLATREMLLGKGWYDIHAWKP